MWLSFGFVVIISKLIASQSLKEVCRLQNGKTGVCIRFIECEYAIQLIKIKRQRPQNCSGFVGRDPIVCCPREKSEISK